MSLRTAILIGGGKSVLEGIELGLWDKLTDTKCFRDIFSINYAFKTMPYLPNKQVWVDTTFFKNNMTDLEALYKQGVECHCKKNPKYNAIPEITQHDTSRDEVVEDKLYIGLMGLSGTFAISLAIKLGYDRIFLLGYDFGTTSINDTHTHYYQHLKIPFISSGVNNPQVYMTNSGVKKDAKSFDRFKELCYNTIIYNVSLKSNIDSFPKISYTEMFEKLNECPIV